MKENQQQMSAVLRLCTHRLKAFSSEEGDVAAIFFPWNLPKSLPEKLNFSLPDVNKATKTVQLRKRGTQGR